MRRLPMLRPLLALGAALILTTAGIVVFWRLDRIGLAPGRLAGGTHQVCSPRDGLVAAVKVAPGRKASAGQALIQLDTRDLEVEAATSLAEMQGLQTDREARLSEMAHLEREVHPREREEAATSRERARLRLTQAEAAARAMAALGEGGLAGRLQVEQAETERKLAALTLEEAEGGIPFLDARHRARIEALGAEVRRLDGEIGAERLEREAALKAIEDSTVRAPVDGVVTTSGLEDLPGRAVRAGDEMIRVAGGAPDRFQGSLTDTGRAVVRPDQQVKIRLDAYPWLIYGTLRGRVERVSDRREEDGGFPVEVLIDPATAPGPLREGMRGIARIVVEEKVSLGRLFLEKATGRETP